MDDQSLPGAVVLVANNERILALETVGCADAEAKKPMQPNSLFWIASMTKSFTATLLMMLVDEGKVNLDDPVEKYLPEFKDIMLAPAEIAKGPSGAIQGFVIQEDKSGKPSDTLRKPTHVMLVRHLLSHMSGISPTKLPSSPVKVDTLPVSEAIAGYAKMPLKYDPGTHYEYSNHGIDTVGRIIEVVSGMPYQDFMQQRLLSPLGMKDTTFWPTDEQCQRLARGYSAAEAEKHVLKKLPAMGLFTYPLSDPKRQPMPSGGLFSTAEDMSLFCRMLLSGGTFQGHRYLSLKSLQQMATTQTGDLLNHGTSEIGYGFCFQTVNKLHPNDASLPGGFGHGGAYGTQMWMDPKGPLITIFMVQFEGGLPGEPGKKMKTAFEKAAHAAFWKR